jgi:hypothetical protein
VLNGNAMPKKNSCFLQEMANNLYPEVIKSKDVVQWFDKTHLKD